MQVCQFLVGLGIPEYITGLPREVTSTPFGAMLRPVLDQMQSQIMSIGAEQVSIKQRIVQYSATYVAMMGLDEEMH